MAIGNVHKNGEFQPCGFRVMRAATQTDRQTNRHRHMASAHHCPVISTKLYCLVVEAYVCESEQLA